jgi:hypothetical protein
MSYYNNILCMQVENPEFVITWVDYLVDEHKVLIFLSDNNHTYVDEYEQCLLYYTMPHYTCSICVN